MLLLASLGSDLGQVSRDKSPGPSLGICYAFCATIFWDILYKCLFDMVVFTATQQHNSWWNSWWNSCRKNGPKKTQKKFKAKLKKNSKQNSKKTQKKIKKKLKKNQKTRGFFKFPEFQAWIFAGICRGLFLIFFFEFCFVLFLNFF